MSAAREPEAEGNSKPVLLGVARRGLRTADKGATWTRRARPVGSVGPGGTLCVFIRCVCGGGGAGGGGCGVVGRGCTDRGPRSGEDPESSCL